MRGSLGPSGCGYDSIFMMEWGVLCQCFDQNVSRVEINNARVRCFGCIDVLFLLRQIDIFCAPLFATHCQGRHQGRKSRWKRAKVSQVLGGSRHNLMRRARLSRILAATSPTPFFAIAAETRSGAEILTVVSQTEKKRE